MKRRFFALLCALMLVLSACSSKGTDAAGGSADTQQDTEPLDPEETQQVAVFVPDAQAEYLTGAYVTVPSRASLPEMLIDGLISQGALPEGVEIIQCSFKFMDGRFELDLNSDYLTALEAGGSAGEAMTLYSVVNTFLFNYPTAESLILTVEGKSIETEHGVYKDPFREMQHLRQ